MRILAVIVANAIALYATTLVRGIEFDGGILKLLVAGAIFGVFNALVRPIALILSIPALILTLGLFYFILNGFLLWLASLILPGYKVAGLWAGILGSLVISLVNWVISAAARES